MAHDGGGGVQEPAERFIVVGLDFGTYASGFAFSTDGGNSVREFTTYADQPAPYPKALTAILYQHGVPVHWGWTAQRVWMGLSPKERSDYTYLEHFKLSLHEGSGQELPADLTPVQVVADFLGLMRSFIAAHLRTALGSVFHPDVVQWCLTVPAMWSEAAKSKMRRAACRAGLVQAEDSPALTIILEPEAAALAARRAAEDGGGAQAMLEGETFMVLDAGGGTVDITVHKVVKKGGELLLSEAVKGGGGLLGSTFVDRNWEKYFAGEVGHSAFRAWRDAAPQDWLECKGKWEVEKRLWDPEQSPTSYVPIPVSLYDCISAEDKAALRVEHRGHDDRVFNEPQEMEGFFEPVLQGVVDLARAELQQLPDGQRCQRMLLVGGFAGSPALVQRMRQELEGRAGGVHQVVVAEHAASAVVKGAVLFGAMPHLICARRSRLTYGVAFSRQCCSGDPPESKFWHKEKCRFYTRGCFRQYVSINQLVAVDDVVEHVFYPCYADSTEVPIALYGTDKPTCSFTTEPDVHKIADLVVAMVDKAGDKISGDVTKCPIKVKLHFGKTQLTMTAHNVATGTVQKTEIVFAHSCC